ncbi:secreted RxLR effector protein 161-like [Dioscorea cayenensis subsp. rotundata]|uniref:Secreted RxLR effector protein 161-like n=1 Tax=Dioscorea cayennensis subsp. rotundata TaxID=55577 RepID=A0AB40B0P3_DIOCR|nr:secreted RxLR effector protein 161-like [Dioscorea cayenensis subsp. rotundata]
MADCNSVNNPIVPGTKLMKDLMGEQVDYTFYKQPVGSLMYLTSTRSDLLYVVGLLNRYMAHPTTFHLQAAKHVLRYIKGTTTFGVFYRQGGNHQLVGYSDSDYAGDVEDRRSTLGFQFLLSSGVVSWSSRKQPIVKLSTTEAEFVTAFACACQAVWLRRMMEQLDQTQSGATMIYCDNSSTIKLSRNPVMHDRSKHIDVRFHFLRDLT